MLIVSFVQAENLQPLRRFYKKMLEDMQQKYGIQGVC